MSKKLITEEFIKRAKQVHGTKYGYNLVNYTKNSIKVKIICSIHGEFLQTPNGHLDGKGCKKCATDLSKINQTKNTKHFIRKSILKHGEIYIYSKSNYINARTKVIITCKKHGDFTKIPSEHYQRIGCPICAFDTTRLTINDIIEQFKTIHKNKYGYSQISYYRNDKTKVPIICPLHGVFYQGTGTHKLGYGCPKCKESKGEREIRLLLEKNNIIYEFQKQFIGCNYKLPLKFDFYIPNINLCIEYNGEQHYTPIKYFGLEKFKNQQINDKIKMEYCQNNNIPLLVIKYDEDIKSKLKEFNII